MLTYLLPGHGSLARRPPTSLVLGSGPLEDRARLGPGLQPLCDNLASGGLHRASLRTPLLEDDRESCV